MRKLLTIIIINLFYINTSCAVTQKDCSDISDLAYQTMILRQKNVDASLLSNIIQSQNISEIAKEGMKGIIIKAYSVPLYNSEANKQKSAMEFKNDTYTRCLKIN